MGTAIIGEIGSTIRKGQLSEALQVFGLGIRVLKLLECLFVVLGALGFRVLGFQSLRFGVQGLRVPSKILDPLVSSISLQPNA